MTEYSGQQSIKKAWLEACELDVKAFKPGNVSVYSPGNEMTVEQFVTSARVCAPHICNFKLSLGEKIFYSIRDTNKAVQCNTNLGIVLLCAPLVQAMQPEYAHIPDSLRSRVAVVLSKLSISDAEWAFKAIQLAQPGGMGESAEHDVFGPVLVTLLEAMKVARDRDRVAYQYATDYEDIFEIGVPRFREAFLRLGTAEWATVAVYAELLSRIPDSLVERKYGNQFTRMVNKKMTQLHGELLGTSRPEQLIDILRDVDREFKVAGINPGTTADLTVASIFAERLGGS